MEPKEFLVDLLNRISDVQNRLSQVATLTVGALPEVHSSVSKAKRELGDASGAIQATLTKMANLKAEAARHSKDLG